MTSSLLKGQKADVTKSNPTAANVIVGMGWISNSSVEVDFSCFMLGKNDKVTNDNDLIFYGNPIGPNQSVSVLDIEKKAYGGVTDKAQLSIHFQKIPGAYERVSFALTIYEGEKRRQNFSLLDNTYIRIVDPVKGEEIVRFNIGKSFSVETAIVVGELYRYNGEWKFNAIAAGYSGGLAALCGSYGIEVNDQQEAAPTLEIKPTPAPPAPPTPGASPINLKKIELKKRGDVINLQKGTGPIGEILVNLNWNQKKKKGFFSSSAGIDLDLGCLFELSDGYKGVIQALGNAFGSTHREPYISLDGDDRTGSVTTGENLRINGHHITEIKRVLVFAYIYHGVTNWSEADGVVTIKQSSGPDIEVRLDDHNNRKGMCAIAMITNVDNKTFSVEKLVNYVADHLDLDKKYHWGLRWTHGSK
ncbi:TerD family protein [Paenibacillus durus]|uniref:Tellurium resistance protein TerA n=1 Tax=Paenibacillus durus ATCC 35681 TaxID=1333534 RepID=A0A0F7F7K6_PAEDU|nr:TerD family protein [Paenibacillus durus]AKG33354.1 tellurium resistance protein TerA [Paenibacillus durus ATCC 35681]